MKVVRNIFVAVAVIMLMVSLGACKTKTGAATGGEVVAPVKPEVEKPAEKPVEAPPSEKVAEVPSAPKELTEPARVHDEEALTDAYFGFDSFELSDEAKRVLGENATWMKNNPGKVVVVEGHCDERGTVEYNLALGEKRAKAAMDYLVALGVDASRLKTISYGKSKPFDPGNDEAAWSKNRRAHFVVSG